MSKGSLIGSSQADHGLKQPLICYSENGGKFKANPLKYDPRPMFKPTRLTFHICSKMLLLSIYRCQWKYVLLFQKIYLKRDEHNKDGHKIVQTLKDKPS